jgi:hypothetical protein
MKYQHPLQQILSRTSPYWDRDETRPAVRKVFRKALQCRTPELGAEVYASDNQELILYHLQIASLPELWLTRYRTVAARAVVWVARRAL